MKNSCSSVTYDGDLTECLSCLTEYVRNDSDLTEYFGLKCMLQKKLLKAFKDMLWNLCD